MSLLPSSSDLTSRGHKRCLPDYELIDDDLFPEEKGDGNNLNDDQHVGDHSVRTAPIFTEDAFDVLGSTNFPQKAVYGRLLSQRLGPSAEASNAINPCVYVNTNAPFSAVVCGVQGSGKSHSTSVLLESCLITDPRLGTLPEPLSGILFHFDSAAGSASAQPCEAAYLSSLHASRGGSAQAPEVTVLVLPSSLRSMTRVYQDLPHVKVRPLHFAAEDISGERLLAMMKVDDGTQMPLYMEAIMAILRSMDSEDTFDYDDFRSKLSEQKFNPSQKAMLNIRLALLDSCLAGGNSQNRISNYFKKGHLTIIDLSSPYMDSTSACGFFDIILGLFIEANTGTSGKIVVLDEAHKYLSENGGGSRLTESLLSVIRQQRHLGTRVVISTQEPTVVPTKFLELCSFIIAHRFSSPKWLQHLAKHMSAADSSMDELLSKIISLRTGQAILFSPSSLCARIRDPSETAAVYYGPSRSSSKPDILPLGQGYLIVRSRQRITRDGGQSILAVQHLEDVVSMIATTDTGYSNKFSSTSRPSSPHSSHSSLPPSSQIAWNSDANRAPVVKSSGAIERADKSLSKSLESRAVSSKQKVPIPSFPDETIPFVRYLAQRAAQGHKETAAKEVQQHFAMQGLIFDETLFIKAMRDAVSCGFSIYMKLVEGKRFIFYVPQEAAPCNALLFNEEESFNTLENSDDHEFSLPEISTASDHVTQTQEQEKDEESILSFDSNQHPYGEHCYYSRLLGISSSAESMLEYLIERHIAGENRTSLPDVQVRLKNRGKPGTFPNLYSSWHELMDYNLVRDERQNNNYLALDVDSIWLHYVGCRICGSMEAKTGKRQQTPETALLSAPHADVCAEGRTREQHDTIIPPDMDDISRHILQYLLDRHATGVDSTALQEVRSHLQEAFDPAEVIPPSRIRIARRDLMSRNLVHEETAADDSIMLCYIGCSNSARGIATTQSFNQSMKIPSSSVAVVSLPQSQSSNANAVPRWHGDTIPPSLAPLARQMLKFMVEQHKAGQDTITVPDFNEHLQKLISAQSVLETLSHMIRDELSKHGLIQEETPRLAIVSIRYIGCSVCESKLISDPQPPPPPSQSTLSVTSHISDPPTPQVSSPPRNSTPKLPITDRIRNLMVIATSENKLVQSWPYVRSSVENHSKHAPKLFLVVVVSNARPLVKKEAQSMCSDKHRGILLICLPTSAKYADVSPSLVQPVEIFAFAIGGTQNYQSEVTAICADLRALTAGAKSSSS